MLGLPSIISLILTLIARKYLKVIEIVGPIFLLTTIATLITLNTNHVKGYNARLESDRTRMQLFYCNMVYMITVLLLTTSYLQHLLVRILLWRICHRRNHHFVVRRMDLSALPQKNFRVPAIALNPFTLRR